MCPGIWAARWFRITHAAVIWMYASCGYTFCAWMIHAVESFIYAKESNIRFCKSMFMGKANLIYGTIYTHSATYTETRLLNTLTIGCIWFLSLFISFELLQHTVQRVKFWKCQTFADDIFKSIKFIWIAFKFYLCVPLSSIDDKGVLFNNWLNFNPSMEK